jgi:signal transduction histidine kinase
LNIHHEEEDCFVVADIALIHRVLQNLIDNAIRHTPINGQVDIRVDRDIQNALIEVSDTGKGIQTHEIPYIFERFYQSQQQEPAEKIGTGLGLAIVKRILELHKTGIDVQSQLNQGTSFIFALPQYSVKLNG